MSEPTVTAVRVGDTTIGEAEVAREMQHHRAADPRVAREHAVRALVVREMLRLEVERLDIGAAAQPQDGETREEANVRTLLEREAPASQPDGEACRRYFEQNRERLRRPDRLRARHILLAAAPGDTDARAQARELGEQLIDGLRRAPARFAELAMRHSACPSRDTGGDLGWIEPGDTTPEFERQVFLLSPGLAGLTVESRWGHHVVHVDEVVRGEPLALEEAMPRVKAYLETHARQHAIHDYLQDLARRHHVHGLSGSTVTP
ncbi:MAG: peptidylprolyl isomerase [Steroidobacteraceae bacterium]|nr:peptidylprolyl isomerase [Pseudomonadota bacterium]MBP6106787.1 peptidylprolyl isomerase [Steroidobacteraceae bacterium]MBP7014782.1 peptidylprolyl isomerase [Steroidobacteraceae bacterium]